MARKKPEPDLPPSKGKGRPKKKGHRPGRVPAQPPKFLPPPPHSQTEYRAGIVKSKELIRQILDETLPDVKGYIQAAAADDPGKAAGLILQLAEFSIPKIARLEVGIEALSDEQLLRELERREELEKRRTTRSLGGGGIEEAEIVEDEPRAGDAVIHVDIKE